jgi:hypothetical protein
MKNTQKKQESEGLYYGFKRLYPARREGAKDFFEYEHWQSKVYTVYGVIDTWIMGMLTLPLGVSSGK